MVERYRTKVEPDKPIEPKKPPRQVSKATLLAMRQATLTGRMPHELMLEWTQKGVMEIARTKQEVRGEGKNARTFTIAEVDPKTGLYVYDTVPMDMATRIATARACADFYAARMHKTQVTGKDEGPVQLQTQSKADAERLMQSLLRDPDETETKPTIN